MALRIEITSEHKEILGEDHVRSFGENGGTIGRGLQNDWILPDPDKFISGKHATIDFQSGAYYLADVSSNGVYVNGADEPLGKGNPRRLFDGDRLRMGDFEMIVTLDEGEDLEMPPEPAVTVVPDHIEQLVSEDQIRSSIMLLDEEAITGDEEFQAALFGTGISAAGERPAEEPSPRPEVNPVSLDETGTMLGEEELLAAFLTAMGISRADIHPSVDKVELMTNAGQVLRELVAGITELLVCRTNVKSMFRLDQTTVMPRHNNPLKLSVSTEDSLKQLLVGKEGEYLGPLDSVREVCRDLKFHHDAVLGGMTRAFGEFIDRFEPDELQDSFDKTLDRKPLFDKLNKLKYWELYCDLYPIITQPGTANLPQQFSEDFVRWYEKHLAEYKRVERSMAETQKIDSEAVAIAADTKAKAPLEIDIDIDDPAETVIITEESDDEPEDEAQAN